MYKIKQIPEDFIVEEITAVMPYGAGAGQYIYVILTKKDRTTLDCILQIAKTAGIPQKNIGFAGTKDRKAVTTQYISIKGIKKSRLENIRLQNANLTFFGYGNEPISLGCLQGNRFRITIRNISSIEKKHAVGIKNYFGEQRFSKNNWQIGKAIVHARFDKAVGFLFESEGVFERKAKAYLGQHPSDFIGALRTIPLKILKLYVHAYQSKLWNDMAARIDMATGISSPAELPLIGFGTELSDDRIGDEARRLMADEGIVPRDFIIAKLPELSSEGTARKLYTTVKGLKYGELEDDELNSGKKKVIVEFVLSPGCYATEAVKALVSQL